MVAVLGVVAAELDGGETAQSARTGVPEELIRPAGSLTRLARIAGPSLSMAMKKSPLVAKWRSPLVAR